MQNIPFIGNGPVCYYSGQIRGLRLSILEPKDIGNCSNNGISARYKTVTLVDPEIEGPFEPSDDAPAVVLVHRRFGDRVYMHLEPLDLHKAGKWCMAGGCYCGTSDSRFRAISQYPLSLHDRVE